VSSPFSLCASIGAGTTCSEMTLAQGAQVREPSDLECCNPDPARRVSVAGGLSSSSVSTDHSFDDTRRRVYNKTKEYVNTFSRFEGAEMAAAART
jgi:hypothetical protein